VIPTKGDPTKQTMPQQSCLPFFVFFAELSWKAYSAYKIKNAPGGASFVL
jgi:hypothetical protein